MEDQEDFMNDMGDTLGEAYDAATTEQPRDDSGRFSSDAPEPAAQGEQNLGEEPNADDLDNEDEGTLDEMEQEEVEKVTAETVEPPVSWTKEARERFANLDADTQAYIVQREQEMEKGVSQLKEQFEGKATLADQFSEMVKPYEAQMLAEGAQHPLQAVQTLLDTAWILRTGSADQKEAIIRQTAQQFGVNLAEPGEQSPENETVAALQKQVNDLTTFIQSQQQQTVVQQQQGILSEIEKFADEKDGKGNVLRPHYSAVEKQMVPLIVAIKQESPGKSHAEILQQAYESAVWANPETRKLVQQSQSDADKAKALEEAKKAATDAKRSKNLKGKGVRPGGAPKPSAKPADWDDDLSEAFDRAS